MIYHAALIREWEADGWDADTDYVPGGFAADGFVHCSTAAQVEGSVNRFLGGHESVVLLWLDDATLGDELRWEPGSLGESARFPHLYSPIARSQVVRAERWARADDGRFRVTDLATPLAP